MVIQANNKIFDLKTVNRLSKLVSNYLNEIEPDTPYYKGKTWKQTVDYRKKILLRKEDYCFHDTDISEILCWGGIHTFKSSSELKEALLQLESNFLKYKIYNRISSFSKLFSFYEPKKYFILDSRVCLTLNHFFIDNSTPYYLFPFIESAIKC